jgi:hypothetical protein
LERIIDIDGSEWRVRALGVDARHEGADMWHLARVRFEPRGREGAPRETWLRMEEDVPATDVLDQYGDSQLLEAFLVAEEVRGEAS